MDKTSSLDVNVAFITDNNYIIPTVVALQSLINNADINRKYNVFVLCDKVEEGNKKLIVNCQQGHENISVTTIDSSVDFLSEINDNTEDIYMVANTTALLKFNLANIFSDIDKLLYLDGDILINCDIAEIFDVDLEDKYVAAVRDLPQVLLEPQLIGAEISGTEYFNSGVMLLNLAKMRAESIKEKLIKIKKERTNDNLMDQNVLNVAFKDSVVQLDLKYNVCYCNYTSTKRLKYEKIKDYYRDDYSSLAKIKSQAKIIHYSSFLKPWVYYDTPFAEIWTKAYYMSPLKNIPLHRASLDGETNISYKKTRDRLKAKNAADMVQTKKIIPVVLCPDHNYAKFATVVIQSIIENSKSDNTEYRVYIFHDDELFLRDKRIFASMSTSTVKVECLDVRNLINKGELYSRAHYSKQMFYRWLIPEVLPQYTKVIYLDCDIVVNSDLQSLYNITLGENNVVGAIKNPLQDQKMRNYLTNVVNIIPENYINSGILVIYTHKFLFENIKQKCLDLLKSREVFLCPDQDVLNIILEGRIKFLPESWNFQWANIVYTSYDKYNKKHDIVHYTSGVKPWKVNGVNEPLAEDFWHYARKSPLYEEIIYKSIDFQINKSIRISKQKPEKKHSKFWHIITWPFRITAQFFRNWKQKNFKYAICELRNKLKYGINRLLRRVDRDNNPIQKKK